MTSRSDEAAPSPLAASGEPQFNTTIPRGCAAAYFPETNVLVPITSVAKGSHQPASKSIPITLERHAPAEEARA